MFGHDPGKSGFTATWRAWQKQKPIMVVLLCKLGPVVSLILKLVQRNQSGSFTMEYNPVPTFEPAQHISIVQLISQQLVKSLRVVLLRPLRVSDGLLLV